MSENSQTDEFDFFDAYVYQCTMKYFQEVGDYFGGASYDCVAKTGKIMQNREPTFESDLTRLYIEKLQLQPKYHSVSRAIYYLYCFSLWNAVCFTWQNSATDFVENDTINRLKENGTKSLIKYIAENKRQELKQNHTDWIESLQKFFRTKYFGKEPQKLLVTEMIMYRSNKKRQIRCENQKSSLRKKS